jgi:hypothetical protein
MNNTDQTNEQLPETDQRFAESATGWCSVILLLVVLPSCVLPSCVLYWSVNFRSWNLISRASIYAMSGLWIIETGMIFLMWHLVFMFRRDQPARVLPAISSGIIVGIHITFVTQGFGLVPFLGTLFIITILGWVYQRVTGFSLSYRAASVYRPPLNTRFFLLLPLIILVLGIIPTAVFLMLDGSGAASRNLTSTRVIQAALWVLMTCSVPYLLLSVGLVVVNASPRIKIKFGLILFVVFVGSCLLASAQPWMAFIPSLLGSGMLFCLGVLLAYWPYHRFGYRIVRAKRLLMSEAEQAVSFDDIQ